MRPGKTILFALASALWAATSQADIYVLTAADGSVSLSDVPADERYALLLAATPDDSPKPEAEAIPRRDLRVPRVRYRELVDEASRSVGLESALLHAVISVESAYNAKAVSKKGAAGLMQLMPGTARRYGVADAFDPAQNIRGGARYLRDLWNLFDGDVNLVLAAFNAGEHAVARHGNRIPPYRETQRYVPRVLDYYRRFGAAAGRVVPGTQARP